MSRLAKKPIPVPANVKVSADGVTLSVAGAKNTLTRALHPSVSIAVEAEGVVVRPNDESKLAKALTGTFAAHVRSMISGVTTPFKKVLVIEGVGYKAEQKGTNLVFAVGFSHPVIVAVPEGITAAVAKEVITIEGADKEKVGQFAAEIRAIKPPEPYLGKGIRYQGEVIRRKQGKKAV